jgi:hypothetical protein
MDMATGGPTEVIRGGRLFPNGAAMLSSENARTRGPLIMRFSKTFACLAAVALLAIAAASPAAAQQLPFGGWTGTMTPPGGQPITVSYEVGELDGVLAIVMRALMVQEVIPFHDVRVEGDAIVFWWEPGIRVDCRLERTATGAYEGPCSDGGDRGAGVLTMVPPAGE